MGNAEINQARFLPARDDLHPGAENLLRLLQKLFRVGRFTQGVGAHHPDVLRLQAPQALIEANEAVERPADHVLVEALVGTKTVCQAHHFLDAVDDLQPAVGFLGDKEMEAVGTEIEGG